MDYFNQGIMNKVMQNTNKPFSDLLDLVYTLKHSISIHLKNDEYLEKTE